METLFACAELLGVEVRHSQMGDRDGVYYDDLKLIMIDPRLSPENERFTLAHEIGHAYLGHRGESKSEEREADEVAALLTIPLSDIYGACGLSEDEGFLVHELGVSSRVIEAYKRVLSNRGLVDRVARDLIYPTLPRIEGMLMCLPRV